MISVAVADWRAQASCATADPDLFFPEGDTPADRIAEAKKICAVCPVKQACLEEALRSREHDGICGGLTVLEREAILRPGLPEQPDRVRRPGKTSARQLAVQHGSYLLECLVEWHMSVDKAAEALGSTPMSVHGAFRMLVPTRPGQPRSKQASVIENLLATSKDQLKTMERRGRSHKEIASALRTSQSFVSASLSVLAQQEDAVARLSGRGFTDPIRMLQDEEARVRRESGAGLTVADVIDMAGLQIRRMNAEGTPLRQVARELGLNREAVRKAHQQMTKPRSANDLTKNQMEEAA